MAVERINELTTRWAARVLNGASTVFSGAAVWPLLAYLAAAADGAARRELAEAVGLDGDEAATTARAFLRELAQSPAVRSAVGVWTREPVELTPWWRATVPTDMQARLGATPSASQALVDEWVRERTCGSIHALPVSVTGETLALLAAALSLKTTWQVPFETTMLMSRGGAWAGRDLDGLKRSTRDRDEVRVLDTDAGAVTVLSVEAQEGIVVELVLGEDGRPADAVLGAALTARACRATPGSKLRMDDGAPGVIVGVHDFEPGPRLDVALPRFSVATGHDLLAHSDLFGLEAATDRATGHFPRMSTFPLAVHDARQVVRASFGELGFEAAAVTAVEFLVAGIPPRQPDIVLVHFDRPFGFVARLRPSNLVLFAGWVADVADYHGNRW